MNAKTAKKLRRVARDLTAGQPERGYVQNEKTGEIRLAHGCTRKVYKELKRTVKNAR